MKISEFDVKIKEYVPLPEALFPMRRRSLHCRYQHRLSQFLFHPSACQKASGLTDLLPETVRCSLFAQTCRAYDNRKNHGIFFLCGGVMVNVLS
jgi:hypothetical protein